MELPSRRFVDVILPVRRAQCLFSLFGLSRKPDESVRPRIVCHREQRLSSLRILPLAAFNHSDGKPCLQAANVKAECLRLFQASA